MTRSRNTGPPARRNPAGAATYSARPSGVSIGTGAKPSAAQVVRAGPHVQPRISRASSKQSATSSLGDQRRELVRPFVDVHVGVQAARLLQLGLRVPGGLEQVERSGRRGEETERVEVRAPHRRALDDLGRRRPAPSRSGQALWRISSGPAGRPSPTRAGRSSRTGRPGRRRDEQFADPRHRLAAAGEHAAGSSAAPSALSGRSRGRGRRARRRRGRRRRPDASGAAGPGRCE